MPLSRLSGIQPAWVGGRERRRARAA